MLHEVVVCDGLWKTGKLGPVDLASDALDVAVEVVQCQGSPIVI